MTKQERPDSESDKKRTFYEDGPRFQNTFLCRSAAIVVGGGWTYCGIMSIPQLLQQPWQLKLISAYELAIAAAAMGSCLFIWGVRGSEWAARIAQLAGTHAGTLLS